MVTKHLDEASELFLPIAGACVSEERQNLVDIRAPPVDVEDSPPNEVRPEDRAESVEVGQGVRHVDASSSTCGTLHYLFESVSRFLTSKCRNCH